MVAVKSYLWREIIRAAIACTFQRSPSIQAPGIGDIPCTKGSTFDESSSNSKIQQRRTQINTGIEWMTHQSWRYSHVGRTVQEDLQLFLQVPEASHCHQGLPLKGSSWPTLTAAALTLALSPASPAVLACIVMDQIDPQSRT